MRSLAVGSGPDDMSFDPVAAITSSIGNIIEATSVAELMIYSFTASDIYPKSLYFRKSVK